MAGFVDRFKRMWDAPDDEYEYGEYDNFKEDARVVLRLHLHPRDTSRPRPDTTTSRITALRAIHPRAAATRS